MPLHDFECPKCGARFEELLRQDDRLDELVCPDCGSPKPKRLPSGTARTSGREGGFSSCGFRGGFS